MVVGAVRGIGRAVKTVQRGRRSVRCEDHIPNRVGTISLIQFLACCAPKCRWSGSPGSGVDAVAVVSRYATPGVKQEMVAVTPCGGRVSHLAPIGREHFENAVLAHERSNPVVRQPSERSCRGIVTGLLDTVDICLILGRNVSYSYGIESSVDRESRYSELTSACCMNPCRDLGKRSERPSECRQNVSPGSFLR